MKFINKTLAILLLSTGQVFAATSLNESTYKYDDNEKYSLIDNSGFVTLSNKSISEFIMKSEGTDWLEFGIRNFKPYKKTNDYWIWKTPKTEYHGLHIIGIYRGVCDITGEYHCGWSSMKGLIFEETEAQVKQKKIKISKNNSISNFTFLNKKRGVIDFTPEDF